MCVFVRVGLYLVALEHVGNSRSAHTDPVAARHEHVVWGDASQREAGTVNGSEGRGELAEVRPQDTLRHGLSAVHKSAEVEKRKRRK